LVLQQQFHSANGKGGEEAKRRKLGGAKSEQAVSAAAAAASAAGASVNGIDHGMLQGLTQMFAKHPEYLKEVQKQLAGGQHQ
jgi:hypothetical protein